MLTITERVPGEGPSDDKLVLPFDRRQKSRLRVRLESGDGRIVLVVAAKEPVALVTARDQRDLMRAAYHLGNRHIPLQIGIGWVLLEQDHVLEHMLEGLGVQVRHEEAPFEPEAGAYGGGHRHGGDDHGHSHDHSHDHGHHSHGNSHD
jgi:urease accessory protein